MQCSDRDEELAASAGDYLADAFAEGGAAVIVATAAHCATWRPTWRRGAWIAAARRSGSLICLDAGQLARLLTGAGRIDRAGVDAQIRPAILAAGEAEGPVRVYGEVVALLWAAGHVNAALELEGFWNELGREIPSRCTAATRGSRWTAPSIMTRSARSAACTARWSGPRRQPRTAGPPGIA